ncbi:MAG: dTDP-4-dehydrorhamnose reductase [Desulfobacteraceae bacterium]|nr:dTDP-4-dehydrorhamnose reductase [Desulfobacteraceae bacterium]MBC2754965.1 dTDP-4-dehydrorhamnose reductase [Desulfobacteraceae bacterium]
MNILITGGNGQLGKDCEHVFKNSCQTTCIDIEDLDITDPDHVEAVVKQVRPGIIINCAAFTQVDACETQKKPAWNVNVTGPKNLAKSARKNNSLLVHISTDYVFDGKKEPPGQYSETDTAAPLSYYGITKREGELAVIHHTSNHIILRTAWLYGFYGQNFLKTILKKALNQPAIPLKIVNDQFGTPTWSYRLALQIAHLVKNKGQGIYHASSEGACSWYDFAKYFLEKLSVAYNIRPCTTDEYPTPAARPKCSILDNRRLKNEKLNIMQHWQKDLDEYIHQYGQRLITTIS